MKPLQIVGSLIVVAMIVGLFLLASDRKDKIDRLESEKAAVEAELVEVVNAKDAEIDALETENENLATEFVQLTRERDEARRNAEAKAAEAAEKVAEIERLQEQHAGRIEEITRDYEARLEAQETAIRETKDALESDDGPLSPVLRSTLERLRELTAGTSPR